MGCYLSTVVSSMDGEATDSDKRRMLSKLCRRSIELNNGKLVVKGGCVGIVTRRKVCLVFFTAPRSLQQGVPLWSPKTFD